MGAIKKNKKYFIIFGIANAVIILGGTFIITTFNFTNNLNNLIRVLMMVLLVILDFTVYKVFYKK
ncbi:MAG: hypothetical protein ACRC41_01515 [Sarcina sp.]